MVRRDVAERVLETCKGPKPNRVSVGNIRSSRKINLQADIIDIGICIYYATRKTAYLAHLESKISSDKAKRAEETLEPLFSKLRRDKISPGGIIAVILGDSIQSFEYGTPATQNQQNALHLRRNHQAYRKSLEERLTSYGILPKNCSTHYAEMQDSYLEATLSMPEATLQLREMPQKTEISTPPKQSYIKF